MVCVVSNNCLPAAEKICNNWSEGRSHALSATNLPKEQAFSNNAWFLGGADAYVAEVGDSRAYLLRSILKKLPNYRAKEFQVSWSGAGLVDRRGSCSALPR